MTAPRQRARSSPSGLPAARGRERTEETREALLADAPTAVGTRWSDARLDELRREHREVTGGWPGTVSEARGRTQMYLDRELAARRLPALTHDELVRVASATYQTARRLWLRQQTSVDIEP